MKRYTCAAIVLILGATGCREQDPEEFPVTAEREPYEQLATAADTANHLGAGGGMSVIAVQGGDVVGGPLTATGQLRSPDAGAPPGAVTITEENGSTRILLTIHGYQAGSQVQAAFVRGSCGEAGQIEEVMEAVITVPAEGVADIDALIERPMQPLFDGQHSLRLLSPDDAASGSVMAGAAHACADMHQMGQ